MADEMTLANLGQSRWDFFRTPYRAPDEDRIEGGRPARPNLVDRFVGNALMSLAKLPGRAAEATPSRIVAKLPEFPDGPNVYAYAVPPSVNIDANSLSAAGFYSPRRQVQGFNQ